MRIWSIHPKYLDKKGFVALWRETLLAKHVLEGKTTAYKNHPQLERFKKLEYPVDAINQYLLEVYKESLKRGYSFNRTKIDDAFTPVEIPVTVGQVNFESYHLLKKLEMRDYKRFVELRHCQSFDCHAQFYPVEGEIEYWEKL